MINCISNRNILKTKQSTPGWCGLFGTIEDGVFNHIVHYVDLYVDLNPGVFVCILFGGWKMYGVGDK